MAADITLTIGIPSGVQAITGTAGVVRRCVLPAGTRAVRIHSDSAFYVEEDVAQTKADAAAGTTSVQQKFSAGTVQYRPYLAGRNSQALGSARYFYLVGTVDNQPIWLTALSESGD